ncbi:hypothetical protein GQ55_7G009100 [Panicum hallii var. hallii]|uniref:Uncharacterized protein n=1 Tax=Panicum hallii var. hallii TaxID=1504633 RepID=A0A2T7CRQ3_9POAL|nr:hypothetical protein GQ55_7G009100 [Panicum hallii var. hallii]
MELALAQALEESKDVERRVALSASCFPRVAAMHKWPACSSSGSGGFLIRLFLATLLFFIAVGRDMD